MPANLQGKKQKKEKRLTSQEENYQLGNYGQGKQQAGGSVADLLQYTHEPQEPKVLPEGKANSIFKRQKTSRNYGISISQPCENRKSTVKH